MLHKQWIVFLRKEFNFPSLMQRHSRPQHYQHTLNTAVAKTRLSAVKLIGSKSNDFLRVHITWLSVATLYHIFSSSSAELEEESSNKTMEADHESIIIEADDLFNQSKFSETFDVLKDQQVGVHLVFIFLLSNNEA
jgi:hypothetical protein